MKHGLAFFKLYCLSAGEVPSTMVKVLNQVHTREIRGKRPKEELLNLEFERFWLQIFSEIYPKKLEIKGMRHMKRTCRWNGGSSAHSEMPQCNFKVRARKFATWAAEKEGKPVNRKMCKGSGSGIPFWNLWHEPREVYILPGNSMKGNIYYYLKSRPLEYMAVTFSMCCKMGG